MDKDDKLVLLEHLRQLNDTLTRLSSRRRRLRAERRVRLGRPNRTRRSARSRRRRDDKRVNVSFNCRKCSNKTSLSSLSI